MNIKKILFCGFLAAVAIVAAFPSAFPAVSERDGREVPAASGGETLFIQTETAIQRGFPFRAELLNLYDVMDTPGLGIPGAPRGFFVGDGYIMKNIDPPIAAYVRENSERIVEFAEGMRQFNAQTYLMLLPTSGAILQQKLPAYANTVMVNQRQLISEVYGSVSGAVVAIDAYAPLIQRQNQYIYYRTENNLTSLGGYYVYAAMLQRMSLGEAALNQFGVDHHEAGFYGALAESAGRTGAQSDSISLYRYSTTNRVPLEFMVRHTDSDGERKLYRTLYPELGAASEPLDVFLGGLSAVTEILSSQPFAARVLIFGDSTALSYASFLAANCTHVTIVDLSLPLNSISWVNPADYEKVVFAYGVESFMHTNHPSKAADLIRAI